MFARLKISRVTRLIVLRVAARGANRLATTMPIRALCRLLALAYSTKCAVLYTGRKRKTDEKSSVLTIRRSRGNFSVTPATGGMRRLYSQALAPFGTTGIQHSAAAPGRHARAEAVGALATHDGRLVSTFHGGLVIQQVIGIAPLAPYLRIRQVCQQGHINAIQQTRNTGNLELDHTHHLLSTSTSNRTPHHPD